MKDKFKHIWCIDTKNYILHEGYILDGFDECTGHFVYPKENRENPIGIYHVEDIYTNEVTAKHMLKGMIQIQRDKNTREIERLQIENERLFEKLINV